MAKNRKNKSARGAATPSQQTSSGELAITPTLARTVISSSNPGDSSLLPKRPNFGKAGRRIRLYANHFVLSIDRQKQPDVCLFRVDIVNSSEQGQSQGSGELVTQQQPRGLPKQLCRNIMQRVSGKLGAYAYDGQNSMYATYQAAGHED